MHNDCPACGNALELYQESDGAFGAMCYPACPNMDCFQSPVFGRKPLPNPEPKEEK